MNNTPPSTPQSSLATNNRDVTLQTLHVVGLIVLISYILVALSGVGTLKNLLLQPSTTPNLADVDPF